jgi:hypothetical protein
MRPLVALLPLLAASAALAQDGRRVTTCRDDGYSRECWERPYDRKRLPEQEERWDRDRERAQIEGRRQYEERQRWQPEVRRERP